MAIRSVVFVLGYMLCALAAAMLVPVAVSLATGDGDWPAFLAGVAATAYVGTSLLIGFRSDPVEITLRGGFLLTAIAWTVLPLFGALPLYLSGFGLDVADAIFESVSGMTTTGSSVLVGLDRMPPSLLVWRSILQWLGGIGIIAMGVAILPFLRVGGMQVFRMESSDRSDKIMPRANEFAVTLSLTYAGLTLICAAAYFLAGMTPFDALNHAMTTISTGGYSTYDASMGHFQSPAIEWIATVFMIAGALPFVLYIRAVRGSPKVLFGNRQVIWFMVVVTVAALLIALSNVVGKEMEWPDAVRLSAFHVVSVVTTTGFASTDYTQWGAFAVVTFFFLTLVGGCSGSTSGGFKIYRFQIIFGVLSGYLRHLAAPNAVVLTTYENRPVEPDVVSSVAMFFFLYVITIATIAIVLAALGLDMLTALSGAATAVANVGPGVGSVIGPAGNFQPLPDAAKLVLALGMILGRLEITTLAVLALPDFWSR